MSNLKKPLKIGFLVTCFVYPKKPEHDLDSVRLERSIVYSWEDFPKREKKLIPLEMGILFQALGYCEVLVDSVVKFRKTFGLPAEGIPFKKYEKLICRAEPGPIYKFDTIPEMRNGKYEQAKKFLKKFVKDNIIANPLSIYLETIFFAGFVDIVYYRYDDLAIQIPFIHTYTTGTIEPYRPPVAIFINSLAVTKKSVHQLIDEHWGEINFYFKKHPYISDVQIAKEKLQNLAMKMKGKTSSQILDYLNDENIKQGKAAVDKEEDAMRQELNRTKKQLKQLICRRKK
ncbi:MAG: hypothetical protein IKN49_06870 [Elusimicrobiaceae bacterium]|nr:hypothetical protein [Elusimicrobiaceae bacterium]